VAYFSKLCHTCIRIRELKKTRKDLKQNNGCPGLDSNGKPTEEVISVTD
jgi:hypothetical protein